MDFQSRHNNEIIYFPFESKLTPIVEFWRFHRVTLQNTRILRTISIVHSNSKSTKRLWSADGIAGTLNTP